MKLINLTLLALLFVLSNCSEPAKSDSTDNNQDVAIEETTSPAAKEKVATPKELNVNDEKKNAPEAIEEVVANMKEKFNLSEQQEVEAYNLIEGSNYVGADEERKKNIILKIEQHIEEEF